jgi:single-stranded-DNA-specific exonuclease
MRYELIAPRDEAMTAVEQVLFNRGIKLEDMDRFKYPSQDDIINPLQLEHMKEGAIMLIKHIQQNHPIFIQVDSDADGYTSAAILINYLNCLFPHFVQTKISYRIHDDKQHGIIVDSIPEGVKLVIAPDSSSNQYEEHEELAKKGIDVLVIDHHEAEKYSDYACVINNQMCDYPTKALSGAGVVYKFCSYIDELLDMDYADDYVDLATVGIIADVMPLKDFEIRHIILKGMQGFRNPLLKTMVAEDAFHFQGKALTPFNIAWYIAPYINAITRSGTQNEKQVVFESMIDFLAYKTVPSTKRGCKGQTETRVEQAVRTCKNVKNRQTKAKDSAMDAVLKTIEDENLLQHKILAIRLDPKYAADKNLTGLIANSLLDTFCRPILILNKVLEPVEVEVDGKKITRGKVYWRGSGRGYDKANLGSLRELLEASGLVEYAQGHASAFGVSIPEENYDALVAYIDEIYKDFDCSPIYSVDLIWDNNAALTSQAFAEIADEEKIWGRGVEDPLIALEGIRIYGNQLRLFGVDKGKPTLNIQLDDGSSLVKFKSSEEEYEALYSKSGYVVINAVGNCTRNNWGVPQFQIVDYDIVGRNEYYF